jgi:hypothetical protein
MSTLTGQQIQSTYQGLLKLADSTTGITQTKQYIQDGLGNNTGLKIATDYFEAPNQIGILNVKGDYYGLGFNASGIAPVANTQNVISASLFYDAGMYDYSAITYNIVTATTSSDVWEVSFYTAQYVDGIGLAPHTQVLSAHTLVTNSTGLKTTSFSSPLSFSGYGGGFYFMVWKLSNSGVTPTVRPSTIPTNSAYLNGLWATKIGFTLSTLGTAIGSPLKAGIAAQTITYSGLSTFNTTYSAGDVATYSTSVTTPIYGFALNTIK